MTATNVLAFRTFALLIYDLGIVLLLLLGGLLVSRRHTEQDRVTQLRLQE